MYECSSWSFYFWLAICGGPQEYITYDLVFASPAVSGISGSSSLYSFRDGRQVAVQLAPCGMLLPEPVQYCSQHSCIIAVELLLRLVCVQVVHPYSSIDTTAAWKKLRFILSVRFYFHMIESLSIAVPAFVSRVSVSFSVDDTLLPR